MGPKHPDITYLQKNDIGGVISKGLAETYQAKPQNPVEFFAKWLLNYRKTEKFAEEVSITVSLKNLDHILF